MSRPNPDSIRTGSRLLVTLALTLSGILAQNLHAAPPLSESKIVRIDVPADRPDVWYKDTKSLIAIPRDEFEALLKNIAPESAGPRPVQLTSANYTATLIGQSLRDGKARLAVQRVGDKPALLPLGQFSLAVRSVTWSDRPATWGTDPAGNSWLLADSAKGDIQMMWSAAGRSAAGELHFDLQLPAAAISTLELKVPRDQVLRCNLETRRVDEGSDAIWQIWRIQMGSERRCRLSISTTGNRTERPPSILFEQDLGAIVREQDLRFQTVFQVECFDTAVTELNFTVPSSVDVYAVTYGQDVPLKWTRPAKTDAAGILTVQLPGPLLGRSRPIRIDGVAVQKQAAMVSPQIAVKDGIFIGGRHTLNIVAPLQLRSFRPTGFRQLTPATKTSGGESYSFQQLIPDGQLVLEVGRPQASLNAQVHTLFEMNDAAWTLTSDLTWTASSGGVFQTECQFPADWEITDVRLPSELGTARLAGWDSTTQVGGHSLLTVEFLEALAPTVPRTIRVLARRRPVSAGTSFPLPLPQPTNCFSVESTLGLILPAAMVPFVSDDARLERISPPDEAAVWAIRPRRLAANQNEFWYRRESTEGGGSVQLVSRLRRVSATSETQVIASPADYTELYRVTCQAEGTPIDRLLVYLTQPGGDVRWSIVSPRQGEVVAQRLPVSQNADWNCPPTGELWELRLPPVPVGSIQIEGRRVNRWLPPSRPALLVVPQSADRRGRVILRHPGSLDVQAEASGLDKIATASPSAEPNESDPPSAIAAIANEQIQTWSFEDPAAMLSLTMRNPERSNEFPTMVSIRLRSLLSANSQGFDLYRAQIRLENGTARDELRIRLPESAILQQVTIAGQPTVPNQQGNVLLLSDLSAARRDVIELLYRVPSESGGIRVVHRIVVPDVSAKVLGLAWEFALPPSVTIFAEPAGVRLTQPLPKSTWTERLFGPLGRPADEPFFNPFVAESWRELIRSRPELDKPAAEFSRDLLAPAEWHVHESILVSVPTEIRLETWQSQPTRLLAWISLVANMIIGVVLRMAGWKYRDRVAAYWLALLVAGALFAPAPYAEIVGGAIAGTVIALLSPRRSLIVPRRDASQSVPLGSTHSFDWGASGGAMLLIALITASTIAQESTTSSVPAPVVNRAAHYTVLVPVDQDGQPSNELTTVYVHPQLLTALRDAARTHTPKLQHLIASADYQVVASPGGADSLKAKFRVHVLDVTASQEVVLPITNAFLTGTDACRINGRPYPVQIAPDKRGFAVTWTPQLLDPSHAENTMASFDLELDLKCVGPRTALGGSFQASVPVVAASRWTMTLPEPTTYFEITGVKGATESTGDQRTYSIDVGATPSVDVRWSRNPPEARALRMEVSQLQHLELRSTHAELRFRARCEPQDGQFDFIDFDLPPKSLVREGDIRAANLIRSEVIAGPQGQPRLRLTFGEPQRLKFTVDGIILIAATEGITHWPLPQFGVTRAPGLKLTTTQNWWSASCPPEYRLEHHNLDADLLTPISSADFLQAWGDSPPTGRLPLLFQPREGSTAQFTVTPQIPRRRAVTWNQTGTVGRRRLEWTVTARLETSQAPVYQHILLVDRRLQIESISVTEGGAERKDRWSENRVGNSPTRVVLFLNDKTTGVQQLVLKGSLPTRFGRNVPLPFVRCEEAELVESRWELFHDRDVEVDLTLPRGVPPFDPGEEAVDDSGPRIVARYQTADPDPKTTIRVSAVQARCAVKAAVALTRGEGTSCQLAGRLKLAPEGESPHRLGVLFPMAFDPARVRVDRAEANWHDPVDGMRRLDLTLMPDAGEVLISFDTVVDEPAKGDWELPLPVPQEATSQQLHLMISPADAWTPVEGTELKPDESPAWAAEVLASYKSDMLAAEYQLGAIPVKLRRNQTLSHLEQPEVRLLDHSVWLAAHDRYFGVSHVYLSQTRDSIDFDVPDGFDPVAIFLDERPLSLSMPVDQKLHIPLLGGARESVLVLAWEQPHPQVTRPVNSARQQFLKPTGIDVRRTLVTVVPGHDQLLLGRDAGNLDWLGAALDRLEMLLSRQESLGNDPRAAAANRRLIHDLQTQITSRLPQRLARPSATLTAHLERWERIVSQLNQLEPAATTRSNATPEPRVMLFDEPFLDLPQALHVAVNPDEPAVRFWILDRPWAGTVGALVAALIAIPAFRRLIRLDWGEWLNTHTTFAWVILGLVWWLCLTPGPVGPVIMTVSLIRSLFGWRQTRNSVMVVDT